MLNFQHFSVHPGYLRVLGFRQAVIVKVNMLFRGCSAISAVNH